VTNPNTFASTLSRFVAKTSALDQLKDSLFYCSAGCLEDVVRGYARWVNGIGSSTFQNLGGSIPEWLMGLRSRGRLAHPSDATDRAGGGCWRGSPPSAKGVPVHNITPQNFSTYRYPRVSFSTL
jgi:hypothetical protein